MRRYPSPTRSGALTLAVPAVLLVAACGSDGAGPAPVDLGGTTGLEEAGAYAILAKTGISNVTGTAISGGDVGFAGSG